MQSHGFLSLAGALALAIGVLIPGSVRPQEAAPVPPPPPQEALQTALAGPSGMPSASPLGSLGTEVPSDAVIQYDPETNSIIVITDEDTNGQIERVVRTLDKPVPQVLIKVLFLEVTRTKNLDFGVEGSLLTENSKGVINDLSTDFAIASAPQGGVYRIVDSDFRAILRALAIDNKLEVLSRPSVLTRNNEAASISIGQEVPFITNSRITDTGQTINTVEYRDVGILLEVTPHITSERLVEMDVYPEISTLTAETVPISDTIDAPVIAKRSAQTRVVVQDGKTVVIGGLMQDTNTEQVRKVPLIGDIPLLGLLFRRTISVKAKTELLIFLTPLVIDTPQALDRVTLNEEENTELTPDVLREEPSQRKYNLVPQH